MRLSDAFLNAFVILVCLLFVTGGVVPPAGAPRVLTEMNQLGPWVAVLIGLVLWRRLRDSAKAVESGSWAASVRVWQITLR